MNRLAEYEETAGMPDQTLVEQHADLVRRIAYHLVGRLPESVDVNDLIQTGMMGLMEAARNFKSDRGANFATYAGIRIRGAMLDELRRGDWSPRSVHRRSRELAEAMERVERRLGRSAEPAEIASEMGIEIEEYFEIVQDATQARMLSVEDMSNPDAEGMQISGDAGTPDACMQAEQMRQTVAEAIDSLPEPEKIMMRL